MDNERSTAKKMADILRALRVQTNGAVSEAMSREGILYPLNYGVSVSEIRKVASAYQPDHKLARLLYMQQVRELRLAALTVADPRQITEDEIDFWAAGVINTEVAEHLGATLLGRSRLIGSVLNGWLTSSDPLLIYAALTAAARSLASNQPKGLMWSVEKVLEGIASADVGALRRPEFYLWRACSSLMQRIVSAYPDCKEQILALSDRARKERWPSADFLSDEMDFITSNY